jgi:hypothetical protein
LAVRGPQTHGEHFHWVVVWVGLAVEVEQQVGGMAAMGQAPAPCSRWEVEWQLEVVVITVTVGAVLQASNARTRLDLVC